MIKKVALLISMIAATAAASLAQNGRVYVATNFTGIQYSLPVELYITVGGKYEVKASGTPEDISWIVVEKNGNGLTLKSKRGNHRFDRSTKLYVSMPSLSYVSMAGSGNLYTKGKIQGDKFTVELAGSGNVNLDEVAASAFSASISGSGNVGVASKSSASNVEVRIAGSGDVNVKNIQSKNTSVNIAGSGDVECYASDSFVAKVAGSGDVTCYGNPKSVEKTKFGSGSISVK